MPMLASIFSPAHSTLQLVLAMEMAVVFSAIVSVAAHKFLGTRGRRALIVLVTFLGGLFFALEYFWPTHVVDGRQVNFLSDWIEPAVLALSIIGAFMVLLGVNSLVQVHGNTLLRLRPGWGNSLAFFLAMIAMFIFMLWDYSLKTEPTASGFMPYPTAIYQVLFNGLYQPLIAATFSLLAFYIASAAYRAFRIRSAEAGLMMIAAFIVMLGQVPIGMWLTHWIPRTGAHQWLSFFRIETFSLWIMQYWNAPAQRAITFGIAVGALAMSLRIWLSLERGTFFSQQPEEAGQLEPPANGSEV